MPDTPSIRTQFRAQRRALSGTARSCAQQNIYDALSASQPIRRAKVIAAYLAQDGEPDLRPWLDFVSAQHHCVGVPKIGAHNTMTFHRYSAATATTINRFGIEEMTPDDLITPSSINVILAPLVAYDDNGSRVGMGGGYYDRYLSQFAAGERPYVIGIAFTCQRSAHTLQRESWDVPLDAICTEAGFTQLSKSGVHNDE